MAIIQNKKKRVFYIVWDKAPTKDEKEKDQDIYLHFRSYKREALLF